MIHGSKVGEEHGVEETHFSLVVQETALIHSMAGAISGPQLQHLNHLGVLHHPKLEQNNSLAVVPARGNESDQQTQHDGPLDHRVSKEP